MKKVLLGCLLTLMAALLFVPAVVADDDDGEKKISVHGEVRARYENVDNMTDFMDPPGGTDDSFDFWPYRVRLGVKGEFSDNVSGYVEVQNFGAFGDSFPYAINSPDTPVPQNLRLNVVTNDVQLYQAYFNLDDIGGSNVSLRVGRQEHTLGNELHMGDADFYNGLSFDGVRLTLDYEMTDVDIFYYNVAERNVPFGSLLTPNIPINGGSDDVTFTGVTLDFSIGDSGQAIEPYILYYKDANEGFNPLTGMPKYSTWTIGALWDRPPSEDSAFDWSLEAAFQSGEAGTTDLDVGGSLIEGWFGFSFGGGSRVHIGGLTQSDDSAGGGANAFDFFVPLFPDLHANNRLGDSDLIANFGVNPFVLNSFSTNTFHNITNYNIGYGWTGGPHGFDFAYHVFIRTEDFGGEDDLGSEWNLKYDYDYSHNMAFEVGLAGFMPGDFFDIALGPTDDSLRFWAQGRLRF